MPNQPNEISFQNSSLAIENPFEASPYSSQLRLGTWTLTRNTPEDWKEEWGHRFLKYKSFWKHWHEGTIINPQNQELQILDRSEGTKVSGAGTEIVEKPLQCILGGKKSPYLLPPLTHQGLKLWTRILPLIPYLSQIFSSILNQVLPLTFLLLFVRVLYHVLHFIPFIILYLVTIYLLCCVLLLLNC